MSAGDSFWDDLGHDDELMRVNLPLEALLEAQIDGTPSTEELGSSLRRRCGVAAGGDESRSPGDSNLQTPKIRRGGLGGTSLSTQESSSKTSPKVAKVKLCPGCWRLKGKDFSFLVRMETAEFPNNGGSWCCLCVNLHRTVYMNDRTLTEMHDWIKVKENAEDFLLNLIAFLMLMQEGARKITVAMISARRAQFSNVMAMISMPTVPSIVMPLIEFLQEPNRPPICEMNLITMRINGVFSVGVFVPQGDLPPDLTVHRASPPGLSLLYKTLASQNKVERDLVSGALAVEDVPDLGASQPPDATKAIVPAAPRSKPMSRAEHKFEAQIRATEPTVNLFKYDSWLVLVKESMFTDIVRRWSNLHSEFGAQGLHSLVESVEAYDVGLRRVKSFLKEHRDYRKTRFNIDRFKTLHERLEQVEQFFVTTCSIEVAPTLQLEFAKSKYFVAISRSDDDDDVSIAEPFEHLTSVVVPAFKRHLKGDFLTSDERIAVDTTFPDTWLRHLLFQTMKEAAGAITNVHADGWFESLADDFGAVTASIEASWCVELDVAQIFQEWALLCSLFGSGARPPRCTTGQIKQAIDALESKPSLRPMKEFFSKSEACMAAMAHASGMVARSSSDSLGDGKAQTARKYLSSSALPKCTGSAAMENAAIITKLSAIADNSAIRVLREASHVMTEALGLWSDVRLSEMLGEVKSFIEDVEQLLNTMEVSMCFNLLKATGGESLKDHAAGCDSEVPDSESRTSRSLTDARILTEKVELCERALACVVPETEYREGLEKWCHWLNKNAREAGLPNSYIDEKISIVNATCVENSKTREVMANAFHQIGELSNYTVPSSMDDAVTEFTDMMGRGMEAGSFLNKAVHLMSMGNALASARIFDLPRGPLGETGYAFDDSEGDPFGAEHVVKGPVMTWDLASDMPSDVLSWSIFKVLPTSLAGVMSIVYGKFDITAVWPDANDFPCELDAAEMGADVVKSNTFGSMTKMTLGQLKALYSHCTSDQYASSFEPHVLADLFKKLVTMVAGPGGGVLTFSCVHGDVEVKMSPDKTMRYNDTRVWCSEVCAAMKLFNGLAQSKALLDGAQASCILKVALDRGSDAIAKLRLSLDGDGGSSENEAEGDAHGQAVTNELRWTHCASIVFTAIKKFVIIEVRDAVTGVATALEAMMPNRHLMVSDTTYNKSATKKGLLDWKGREQLADDSVQMFRDIKGLKATFDSFKFGSDVSIESVCGKDEMGYIRTVYEASKALVHIIAACSAIQEMRGKPQVDEATRILSSKGKDVLPSPLVKELQAIATGSEKPAKRLKSS
ncbi:unnamed protein product [Prorocentrum cordatum]|uniref:Uncharacterized protein n=1 Tax=Prorocentrum cordatum TaxID=2364126 RepID=A0ABN9UXA8_9DINO|nr:unnamed protein product [Polarella glacialis]